MKQCEGLGKDALIRKSSTIMDSGERGERNLKRSQLKYFSDIRFMDELTGG